MLSNDRKLVHVQGLGIRVAGFLVLSLSLILSACGGDRPQAIVKPDADQRDYHQLRLDNGIKVVLISDPDAPKAAAALDVAVGSADDPEDRAGLAHFLEHMLFLGTEKYPEADDYMNFISQQGGRHNAWTSSEHTNYFFDVKADALEPALDRFAQFFIAPLFTEAYVDRERNAVHSEYKAKIKDSYRRERDVFSELANPAHPLSKFSVGNLDSLEHRPGVSLRDQLIEFYNRHYSADRMTLVVLGREDLSQLEEWVREKFSAVATRNTGERAFMDAEMFTSGVLPLRLHVHSVKEEYRLEIAFPVPSQRHFLKGKPLQYIAHFLGHEGEGSLYAVLKAQGLVESLAAWAWADGSPQGSLQLSINLTEDGYQRQSEVVSALFAMIDLLREEGISEWRYNEQARLADMSFRFSEQQEAASTVSQLANALQSYSADQVMRGPMAMDDFDADLIDHYLSWLAPQHMVWMSSSHLEKSDRISQLYSTPYRISLLDYLDELPSPDWLADLQLPNANPFVAENPQVLASTSMDQPQRHDLSKQVTVWHQFDKSFDVPKASFIARIESPDMHQSAEDVALLEMYSRMLRDRLNSLSYPAMMAGLAVDVSVRDMGLELVLSGYDERQQQLLDAVLPHFSIEAMQEQRFDILQQEAIKQWRNSQQLTPYKQGFDWLPATLVSPRWSMPQLADALQNLDWAAFNDFLTQRFQRLQIEVLAHGNISEARALAMAKRLENVLAKDSETLSVQSLRVAKLDPSQTRHAHLQIDHQDRLAMLYIQAPDNGLDSRVKMDWLRYSIRSDFFNQLRTEQQLGYIVFAAPIHLKSVPGIMLVVQSPSTDLADIQDSIEGFLAAIEREGLSSIETYRQALLDDLKEPSQNLLEQSQRLWSELQLGHEDFSDRQRRIDYLEQASAEDFLESVNDWLNNAARLWLTAAKDEFVIDSAVSIDARQSLADGEDYYLSP